MRLPLAAIVMLAALAPLPAFAGWMSYVGRNIATGERTGPIARGTNLDERPALSVACTNGVLTATFDSGVAQPAGIALADLPQVLSIAADDGEYDAFPVTPELHDDDKGPQIRLSFSTAEAAGLVQYVLGAEVSIQVSYRIGDEEVVHFSTSTDSAAITLGGVLRECPGTAGKTK